MGETRTLRTFCQHLRQLQFSPRTIIDVGVAWGTPELYQSFPESYLILFEPLDDFAPQLEKLLRARPGEFHRVALAERDAEGEIFYTASGLGLAGASIFSLPNDRRTSKRVQVSTMDGILGTRALDAPLFVKIDAQRADLLVVKGGTQTIAQADVVVMETNLFEGAPGHKAYGQNVTADVIAFMDSIGFALYDVVGFTPRAKDNALGQVDLAFVKAKGPFRSYTGW